MGVWKINRDSLMEVVRRLGFMLRSGITGFKFLEDIDMC